jgi:hypothetical protein
MKNFWLDRKAQRLAEEEKKFDLVYPKQLWHYVSRAIKNRRRRQQRP